MRHRKAGRKLGRTTSHRKAMLRNMVTSLLKEEKIVTTDARAKELRSVAEKMITLGKRGDLHARRQADAFIRESVVTKKLFEELSPRYGERSGGYTRIVKIGHRPGDNAPISVIELIPAPGEKGRKKETPAKKK
jgi:large subunit ribosomal protein L17